MRKFVLSTVFACLASSTAFAADAVVDEVVVAPVDVFVWTGGYVGLQAGYAWGDSHLEFTDGDFADPDPDGFIGGIYAGYNYQAPNNLVVGIDADITYADIDGFGSPFEADGTPAPPGNGATTELNWNGAVRGRLGYAAGRFLPYIAGGVAFADVDVNVTIVGETPVNVGSTYVGWTIGGGADFALTDNLILRGEYRYTDFGDEDYGPIPPDNNPYSVDLKTHDVRLGIAYKF